MAKKKQSSIVVPRYDPDYIIGLDMSLTSPGWARLNMEDGYLTSGFWDIEKSKLKGMPRLIEIRKHVKELVIEGKNTFVLIEGYAFGARGRAGISLGELGGVVRSALYDLDADFVEIPPKSLKKFITGTGTAGKGNMMLQVFKKYGVETLKDDEADAVALVELGKALKGKNPKPLAEYQKEVISNL